MSRTESAHFWLSLVLNRLLYRTGTVLGDCGANYLKRRCYQLAHAVVRVYLSRTLAPVISEWSASSTEECRRRPSSSTVWICWFQGEPQAPQVVRLCLASARRAFGADSVVLVTDANVRDIIDIPPVIDRALKAGNISLTHFSDFVRARLLNTYGGLWIDATVYVARRPAPATLSAPIVTRRTKQEPWPTFVSDKRWTGFLMGGDGASAALGFVADALEHYWEKQRKLIHYLLIDYLLDIAYRRNICNFQALIDDLPESQPKLYDLVNLLQEPGSVEVLDRTRLLVEQGDTQFFKLDWRLSDQMEVDQALPWLLQRERLFQD